MLRLYSPIIQNINKKCLSAAKLVKVRQYKPITTFVQSQIIENINNNMKNIKRELDNLSNINNNKKCIETQSILTKKFRFSISKRVN